MIHQLICIQSDDVEKAILIATFDGARKLTSKKQDRRSRSVALKKVRAKAQRRKAIDLERGISLRLCAFVREIFGLI